MQGYDPLSVIIDRVLDYSYQQSTAKVSRAKEAVNRFLQQIGAFDWPQLLWYDETGLRDPSDATLKTFMTGESWTPMPVAMGRLKSIQMQTPGFGTGTLEALDPHMLYQRAGALKDLRGPPLVYAVVGMTAQIRPLSVAATPTATSDVSDNDTGGRSAMITYRKNAQTALGKPFTKKLTGVFSAGVSLGVELPPGYPIERVVLDQGWLGKFEMNDGTDTIVSVEHTREPETQASDIHEVVTHQLIRPWPVPDQDYPATVGFTRKPREMADDDDTPEIPVSEFLVEATIAAMMQQEGRHKDAAPHQAAADTIFRQLTKTNKQNAARRMTPRGRNFLGANGVWT